MNTNLDMNFNNLNELEFVKDNSILSFISDIKKNDFIENEIIIGPFDYTLGLSFSQIIRDILLQKICVFRIKNILLTPKSLLMLNAFGEDSLQFFNNLSKVIIKDINFEKLLLKKKSLTLFDEIEKYKKKQKKKIKNHFLTLSFNKGPGIIRSNNIINLPEGLIIVNKNQFLGTINYNINIDFKLLLDYNSIYNQNIELNKEKRFIAKENIFMKDGNLYDLKPIYNPISLVNFSIEKKYNKTLNKLNDNFNQYQIENYIKFIIKTDGSISSLNSFILAYINFYKFFTSLSLDIKNK